MLASRSRSPPSGRNGWLVIRPMPRCRARPRRPTSTMICPASRRASSRSFGSVAPVRSASRASAWSGSSSMSRWKACSSSWPTSGEISSKCSWRPSSRREAVRREASATASSAAAPSLTSGELVAPFGAPAFPWPSPSARRPKTSAHNSVTISSAVRDVPSRNRIRPDRAIMAASRPTLGLDTGSPRSSAEAGRDGGGVDGASHRRADAHLRMGPGPPDQLDELAPATPGRPRPRRRPGRRWPPPPAALW